MAAVERGRQVRDQFQIADRPTGKLRIRIASEQVASEADGRIHFPTAAGFDARHRVETTRVGTANTETLLEPRQDCLFEGRCHTDRSHPLHVAVPADRQKAGMGPPDHPAQESQVGNHLHVLDAVQMVRDAHRPSDHHVGGRHVHLGHARDRLAGNPGAGFDISPGSGFDVLLECREALGVRSMNAGA